MYLHYVDDILLPWEGSTKDLEQFIQALASVYPSINFTVEEEQNARISFLNLEIHTSSELLFSVHHRNNNALQIIPSTAFRPLNYMNSAITSLMRRAYLLPSNQALVEEELQLVSRAMQKAGYSRSKFHFLQNCVKNKLFSQSFITNIEDLKIAHPLIPFLGPISLKIVHLFRMNGFILPLTTQPTLRRLLCNDRDIFKLNEKSGFYQIPLKRDMSGEETSYMGPQPEC
ncbi:uncharacterized protein LOC111618561 [Centruroides sculpturatus]|uniref:uncharacterized protein LOC111618561 n=1 Tax=Centruroides sculpturatus TaxID=218467 RepID=UPI000C6E0725|nr:uncharacterized protein LOC111618561 [Centruroides sculpturatus]